MTNAAQSSQDAPRARAGYKILGSIASGGMGTVSLALRTEEDGAASPIAVKRLHASRAEDPESVAMFLDEARIASRIVHPNVLRIRDVEMLGEELVILMDYVEGVSLGQLLRSVRERGEELPVSVARRILHDVLLGLHAAHGLPDESGKPLGIVHRDVSPHNLLVGSEGLTRVADFGIALASGRLASTQSEVHVKGKLRYLSPEQIYRRGVDRRVDVFAAGIVLWECLTGRKLFAAGTEGETLAMILREPIAPPSLTRFDVPMDLDEICLKALEREPGRRFATAREFAEALEAGGLSTRREVAALVERCEGTSFEQRRALLREAEQAPFSAAEDTSPGRSRPVVVAERSPMAQTTAGKKRARAAFAISALLIGGLAGAFGAKLSEARRDTSRDTSPARALAPAEIASAAAAPPSARESAQVDLDESPAAAQSSSARDPAGDDGRDRSRPAPSKPKAKGAPASAKRGAPPARPFMPSDL